MTTRGVFRLSSYRSQELIGDGVPMDDVWYKDKLQQDGYVVGGSDSSDNSVSYYQSLSYDTDTRSNVANLPQAKSGVYAVASPSNGYVIGGGPGNPSQPNNTYYSNTTKLSFSTQTSSALPGVDMSESFGRGGSAGSTTAGYVCGGYSGPGGEGTGWSRLEKLTYSSETIARIPGSNLPGKGYGGATGWDHAATGNGDDFAVWIAGNRYPSPSSSLTGTCVFKLNYSNDSWSHSTSWNLSGPGNRMQKAGMTSSDTGAYIVGGSYPANTRIQKISFADMTNSVVTNSASPGRTDLTATGNSSSGYYAGGATGNNANGTGGSVSSIVDKMNFSTNSISRVPALDLANGLSNVGSMSAAGDNKVPPAPKRWIDNAVPGGNAIDFDGSGDYLSVPTSTDFDFGSGNFTVECWVKGTTNSDAGFVNISNASAGSNSAWILYQYQGKIWFGITENTGWDHSQGGTISLIDGDWHHIAATREGNTFKMWVDGVFDGSFDYSGSIPTSTRPLEIATQNGSYLYTGQISNVRVIKGTAVYTSNFTVPTEPLTEIGGTVLLCCNQGSPTAATKTPGAITANGDPTSSFNADLKFNLEPTATPTSQIFDNYSPSLSNDGYLMGGTSSPGPSGSSAAKVLFATDTITALPNTPMRAQFQGGMSSSTYGYSVAGYDESVDGAARYRSQVYKIQYSTDSYSSQGNYPAGKVQGLVGVSAGTTHGYVAGGANYSNSNDGGKSSIQKFTFATSSWGTIPDKLSQDLMPSSPVPVPTGGSSGGNREHGYWVAMNSSSNPNRWGQMTKIAYSTDTTYSGLPRMFPNRQSNTGMESTSACSSKQAMYVLGNWLQPGPSPSKHSTMFEKWTFSTDTSALLPSSTPGLTSTGGTLSGMGNWEYGIHNGSGQCKKIVYATETTTQNPATSTSGLPTPRWDREGIAVSARDGDGGKVSDPVVC